LNFMCFSVISPSPGVSIAVPESCTGVLVATW
jgi:hypothetical protein